MDKALQYLGIARKAGKLALGENDCEAICTAGKARLMLLAADASPNVNKCARNYLQGRRAVSMVLPYTKADLGAVLGRASCGMVCLTDLSLAARFAAAMAETDEEWNPTAELLSVRDSKAQKRKAAPHKHDNR